MQLVYEDGKLVKQPYKPPSNPEEVKQKGEAQSLVTYSLINTQTKNIQERKPVVTSVP